MSDKADKAEQAKEGPREKAEKLAAFLKEEGGDEGDGDETKRRATAGIVDSGILRTVLFVLVSLGLFVTGALSILAVWGYVESAIAWRAIATLGIAVLTFGLFIIVNEAFGSGAKP